MITEWKPKRWIALLLALVVQPFGFLYINRANLFWLYLLLLFTGAIADMALQRHIPADAWYQYFSFSLVIMAIGPLHIFLALRRLPTKQLRRWYSRWWGLVGSLVMLLAITGAIRAFIFEPFTIPSQSMRPTLEPGNIVIINKVGFGNYDYLGLPILQTQPSRTPRRGDLMVFKYPRDTHIDYVQRVVGLPGDRLIYRNKQLLLKPACEPLLVSCDDFSAIEQVFVDDSESTNEGLTKALEQLGHTSYHVLINPSVQLPAHYFYQQPGMTQSEWLVPEDAYFVLGDNRDNSVDSRFWGFVPAENLVGEVVFVW